MSEEEQQQRKEEPIIIKKKKGGGGHGGHHGGAWKVAYADFVTAMMAFFIVMWILASSQEVKEEIVSYFQEPGAFNFLTGKRTIPVDLQLRPSGKGDADEGDKSDEKSFKIAFDANSQDTTYTRMNFQAIKDSMVAAEKVEKLGEEFKKQIDELMKARPDLNDILSSIKIEMTKEGLRIELIESTESLFFEVGSSKLNKEAREILMRLATEIGKLPNYIDIEDRKSVV